MRPPAVADMFYPGSPARLTAEVDAMLDEADASIAREGDGAQLPKALVLPHAGYVYSGPIAARGYALLRRARGRITRVVLLGPAHRVYVRGCAVPDAESFATPLGVIPLETATLQALAARPDIVRSAPAHAAEHSLEVHLPFLQRALGDGAFTLVPIVVGDAAPVFVADVLRELWGGDETLVVVSSDLSHYLPYDAARAIDGETAAHIVSLSDADLSHDRACGATPVAGLLHEARRRRLRAAQLDLRNSGDTAGTRDRVVGYGAFGFYDA